ncbi:MAG: FUSC family protein [Bryobacteraceae bacterium]
MSERLTPWARSANALWGAITRLDKSKINSLWIALRNSLAVALPLGVGIQIGNPSAAVAVATGALNVSYSDGTDAYSQRARRMLIWSLLGGIAVFIGSATGRLHVTAILVAMAWAFMAGMLIAVSTRAGDLGLNTLVVLVVFAARGPTTVGGAVDAALLVLGGGLLQMTFALLLWPVHPYDPEKRAIAAAFRDLAAYLGDSAESALAATLATPTREVQEALGALGRDHTAEGERLRVLVDQTDRIRLSSFQLRRLGAQLSGPEDSLGKDVDQVFEVAVRLVNCVSDCLLGGERRRDLAGLVSQVNAAVSVLRSHTDPDDSLAGDIAAAADVFIGQLRSVARLADNATPEGEEESLQHEAAIPLRLRVGAWIEILRANLSFRSAVFRHALRLSMGVGLADALGHSISWDRSYWIPMTVAVILKPDFTATISRGALRLLGTVTGLMLATLLYHATPGTALTQLLLVGIFTFAVRMYGPANYGIFSICISGLIVFLIAETGIAPAEVVWLRLLNTTAGGLLALLAYTLWPTWERTLVSDAIAEMIDATRLYFQALIQSLGESRDAAFISTIEAGHAWRRARSNAEASVDRTAAEPRTSSEKVDCLNSMLASSHSLANAMAALEAGFLQSPMKTIPPALDRFARDVDFTLYYLSAALRGSAAAHQTLPKLREDHRRLMEARQSLGDAGEFVLLETDRITVTLNTFREQVMRYMGIPAEASAATTPAAYRA